MRRRGAAGGGPALAAEAGQAQPLLGPLPPMSGVDLLNAAAPVLVVSFVVALFATPLARRLALTQGIVDRPNEARKIHREPIPYLGGLAVFAGAAAGMLAARLLDGLDLGYPVMPIGVLVGMVAITLAGLGDDMGGWDPWTKIAGQLVAAAGLALSDIGVNSAAGALQPFFVLTGIAEFQADGVLFTVLGEQVTYEQLREGITYWVGIAVIAIFILGLTNATNFIDGLDGLCSGVVGIFALGVLVVSILLVPMSAQLVDRDLADAPGGDAAPPRTGLVEREARDARDDVARSLDDVRAELSALRAEVASLRGAADDAAVDLDGADADEAAEADAGAGAREADGAAGAAGQGPWADADEIPREIRARVSDRMTVARVVLAMALLGAVLGFLPWNFNPAVIFLGDCGSLMLGYLCAVLILMLGDLGRTDLVLAGLIIFSLPIMDLVLAIVRRRLAGVSMTTADSEHLHHQMRRAAGTVRRAVLALYGVAAVFALTGAILVAMVMADVQARAIYAVAIILFAFVGVLALKAARQRATSGQ